MKINELHNQPVQPDTYEASMAQNQLLKIGTHSIQIHNLLKNEQDMESWVAKKIDLASSYVKSVHGYTAGSKAGAYDDGGMSESESDYLYLRGKEIDQGSIVYDMQDYSDGIFELQSAKYADGTELDEKELEELESTQELIDWVMIDFVSESAVQEDEPGYYKNPDKEFNINGMTTKQDVVQSIIDNLDNNELDTAKDSLNQLLDVVTALHEDASGWKLVSQAKEIAKKMAGNMTGAVKQIEKLQKDLSKNSSVEKALLQFNEGAGEGHMSKSQLYQTAKMAIELIEMIKQGDDLEGWVQTKLNLAADYLQAVHHYEEYQKLNPYREQIDSNIFSKHSEIVKKNIDEILARETQIDDVDTKPGMMRILGKRVNDVEKEIAKENRKQADEDAAGVGIITKQNTTSDVKPGDEYKNVKKLGLKSSAYESKLTDMLKQRLK